MYQLLNNNLDIKHFCKGGITNVDTIETIAIPD